MCRLQAALAGNLMLRLRALLARQERRLQEKMICVGVTAFVVEARSRTLMRVTMIRGGLDVII